MLFISNAANFSLKLRSPKPVFTPNGELMTTVPKIKCWFQHGVAPRWALEVAQTSGLLVRGKPDGENLQPYYSMYDTDAAADIEAWDEATKEWVEKRLLRDPSYGSSFIRVELPRAVAPYPNYEKNTTVIGRRTMEHVLDVVREDVRERGYEIDLILQFERDTQRKESAAIIAALEALKDEPAAELVEA